MSVTINTSELKETLELTPSKQNVMLVGKHGIGKSEILTSYFESISDDGRTGSVG